MADAPRRARLALRAYMAQVRESVAKALAGVERAAAQVADWTAEAEAPIPWHLNPAAMRRPPG